MLFNVFRIVRAPMRSAQLLFQTLFCRWRAVNRISLQKSVAPLRRSLTGCGHGLGTALYERGSARRKRQAAVLDSIMCFELYDSCVVRTWDCPFSRLIYRQRPWLYWMVS